MEPSLPIRTEIPPGESTRAAARSLRIVLAGCGAVSRLYYAPALTALSRQGLIRIAAVFDPDEDAMHSLRGRLADGKLVSRFEDLLDLGADMAVVASPPSFHADQTVAALEAGLHVFCEKPMATSLADADRVVATATATGRVVAVGLVRRQFPATRTIKELLTSGILGRLRSVSCFEGGPFDWPVASMRYFSRAESGGGVLQDVGTHCLDLLAWWFGAPRTVHYADDAMGGIEANCLLRLTFPGVDAHVRLSRDWARPNRYLIQGERGWIGWTVNETEHVEFGFAGAGTTGRLSLRNGPGGWPEADFQGCFARQIAAFVQAIRAGEQPEVSSTIGRDLVALIERCYRDRALLDMPWLASDERKRAAVPERGP
jgi:myo-inositol 2-dehydrogenase / D-chiro-inositol 1-dehydrogenase